MRTFNLRLILWLAGIFVVTAVVVHFVHDYQVRRNAVAFLGRAQKSEEIVRDMAKTRKAAPEQIRDAVQQTVRHYSRYLSLRPNDLAVRIEYAKFLLDINDSLAAYIQNERILRANLDNADDELRSKVEEVRERQIQLAIRLRRLTDAIYHIDELKKTRADDPALWELRGQCQLSQEDSREANQNAIKSLETAIELAPHQVSSYALLANLQRDRLDQWKLADATIAKMIDANPDSADAYVIRAQYLLSDTDPSKRVDSLPEEIRQMIDKEKEPAKRIELLQAYNIRQATADCEKARQLDPRNANALFVYARCLESAAEFEPTSADRIAKFCQARDLLNELVQAKPLAASLYLQLSNLELKIGHETPSRESAALGRQAAIKVIRDGWKKIEDVAISQPEMMLDLPQMTFDLRWRLADLLIGDKDEEAVKEVDVLLVQLKVERPESPLLPYLDGRRQLIQQQWLSAKKTLEEVRRNLQLGPDLVSKANTMLGICYSQLGDQDLRLEIAQQAVSQRPRDVEARIELAETLISLSRMSEALQQFQEIVRMRTPTPEVLKRYTYLVMSATAREDASRRNWDTVNSLIDAVAKANPDDPWVPIMRAEVQVSQENPTEAEKVLEEARQAHPNQFTFGNSLLELANQQKDYDKAARRLDELQQQFGDTLDVRTARARLLIKQEGLESVPKLAELAEGLENFSQSDRFQFYWQLARLCLQMSDTKEGLRYGQEAAKLMPNSLQLRLFLLDLARAGKDVQAGQQLASEIEKLEGTGPVSLYAAAVVDLIRHQAEQADTLGAAQQKLAAAAQQRKRWSDVPVLQGIIAAVQGDQKAALNHYKQAISLGNMNTAVVFQVVNSLYREGRLAEADTLVRKVQSQRAGLPLEMGRLASRINFRREDYDRALELAESLPSESNAVEDALWVGYLQLVNQDYDEAQQTLENVVNRQPDSVEGWLTLVRCLKQAGKVPDAEAKMQEAATKVKPELQAFIRAECLRLLDRPEEAVAIYREAVKAAPDTVEVLKPATDLFRASSETRPEAKAILERFVKGELATDAPTMNWARNSLARLLAGGNYADQLRARELVKTNLDDNPESAEDLELSARLLSNSPQLADRQAALNILQQMNRDGQPLESDSLYLLARQCMADGNWPQYKEQMVKLIMASQKSPRRQLYFNEYINTLLEQGDTLSTQEAEGLARTFQREWRNEIASAVVVAKVQAAGIRPDADAALKTIKQAVENPNVLPAEPTLKMEYAVHGLKAIEQQVNEHIAKLRQDTAASADTKVPEASGGQQAARLEIANRLETQMEPIKATIDEYIGKIVGDDPKLQLLWVSHLVSQGKKKEAVEVCQQHWQEARFDLLVNAFAALFSQTEIDTADRDAVEVLLMEAIKRAEGKPEELLPLLRVQATYYVNWGRYDQAKTCYEQIVSMSPGDVNSVNNLAMIMASQKQDVPAALAAINKVVELVGPITTFLDTQAMVLLANGQNVEALEVLRRVVAEQPARITKEAAPQLAKKWGGYHFHLALALQANGKGTEAGEAMDEAEKLGFTREDVFKPELDSYEALKKALP